MLTQGEDVEVHALARRGWSISAIARHLERDRKTVRAYVRGERQPGVRRSLGARPASSPSSPYLAARFADDPHLWLTALFDEVVPPRLSAQLPDASCGPCGGAGLRPHCEACAGVQGRLTIEIEHPPGEEIQWDWFERRRAPWGGTAYVLLGTLPHSGRVRGVLAESMDQPHLVEAIDGVLRRLGGTARDWRTDRLATVIVPGTRDVQPSFAPGGQALRGGRAALPAAAGQPQGRRRGRGPLPLRPLVADARPPRRMEEAQASLDRFCATVGDARPRGSSTVGRAGRRRAAAGAAAGALSGDPGADATGGPERHGRLPGQRLLGASRASREPR